MLYNFFIYVKLYINLNKSHVMQTGNGAEISLFTGATEGVTLSGGLILFKPRPSD